MNRIVCLALCGLSLWGCKSEADKCYERNTEVYERQVKECKDDACKEKALLSKKDFDEACASK